MKKSEIYQASLLQVIENCKLEPEVFRYVADSLCKIIEAAREEGAA
jgi:hypothetical protein